MEGRLFYGKRKQPYGVPSFNNNRWKWNSKKSDGGTVTKVTKKFRWYDGNGRQLTAGGLLPYDDEGIWVIGEKKTKDGDIEWTDPGGKYKFEDCDIYTTITREFSEELYHSSTISRDCIMNIKENNTPTYVNGHQNKPVYVCYIVHTSELKQHGVKLDKDLFLKNRYQTLIGNPDVPPEYYSSVELKHISFSDIKNENLSYRLRRILKYGTLSSKLSFVGYPMNRSITPDTSSEIFSEEQNSDEEQSPEEERNSEERNSENHVRDMTSPIPIKASSPPVLQEIEKVLKLNIFGTSPPLIVGGK